MSEKPIGKPCTRCNGGGGSRDPFDDQEWNTCRHCDGTGTEPRPHEERYTLSQWSRWIDREVAVELGSGEEGARYRGTLLRASDAGVLLLVRGTSYTEYQTPKEAFFFGAQISAVWLLSEAEPERLLEDR